MQKLLTVLKFFDPLARFILLTLEIFWLLKSFRSGGDVSVYLFILVCLLLLLDIGRFLFPFIRDHPGISTGLSIVLCVLCLCVKAAGALQIYYFFLMDEIFNKQRGRALKGFAAAHFIGFMASSSFAFFVMERRSFLKNYGTVLELLAFYALILFIFGMIHYFKWDRERLKILNANLIEYSFQEREYLLAEERGHISQELHDSLGHSLMAVLMNVRYLKAIRDKDRQEQERQIDEIEELLKECVDNLRGSVYSLRKLDDDIQLRDEIERIIRKFGELGLVKIRLSYDNGVEQASNRIRSILHRTIRESITNSIRHGNATLITISIRLENGRIALLIKDNGRGCADIQKSFGLNGILERVQDAGGEVLFISARNKGFTVKAELPAVEA